MGNCITSIKNLNRISMLEIFENINGVEDILKQDPANVYEKMDYQTRIVYRNAIKEIAQKTKISEIYIAKKVWHLADKAKGDRQKHVGYYLISDGKGQLLQELTGKKTNKLSNDKKNCNMAYCTKYLHSYNLYIICKLFLCKKHNFQYGLLCY